MSLISPSLSTPPRFPTDAELSAHIGITPSRLTKVMSLTHKVVSLEVPKYKNSHAHSGHSPVSLLDTVASRPDSLSGAAAADVDRSLFKTDLVTMMAHLSDSEKLVIRLRYGVEDGTFRTVAAVATLLGRRRQWVRSKENKALRKLRRPWYEERLKEHQEAMDTVGANGNIIC